MKQPSQWLKDYLQANSVFEHYSKRAHETKDKRARGRYIRKALKAMEKVQMPH